MGDGVLAYFGWPQAHEDDAERAVRAGLQLVDGSRVSSTGRTRRCRSQARVGIATGLVVVGELIGEGAAQRGGGGRRDAEPRGAAAGAGRARQRGDQPGDAAAGRRPVRADDLGPQRLKGFAEPLAGVAGRRRGPRRRALRGAPRRAASRRWSGASEELALLLRRWQQAKDGEGQVVLLSGEPGIGKSRLVRSCAQRLERRAARRLLYQCSPHHTTSAAASGDRRSWSGPPASRATIRRRRRLAKLEALLGARRRDRLDQAVPLIAALLGVPTGERYPPLDLTPAAPEAADAGGAGRAAGRARGGRSRCCSPMRTCTGSTRPRRSCSA